MNRPGPNQGPTKREGAPPQSALPNSGPAQNVAPTRPSPQPADPLAELERAADAYQQRQQGHGQGKAGPPDEGFKVATIKRSETEELRVRISTFNGGAPFLRFQVWTKGSDGSWWPAKGKGLTVKLRELGELAKGLVVAMKEADRLRAEYRARQAQQAQGGQQRQGWGSSGQGGRQPQRHPSSGYGRGSR